MEVTIGGINFTEVYMVEQDGEFFGPFESKSDACDFAMRELDLPFTIHALNKALARGV